MAKLEKTVDVEFRVFRCNVCSGYLISVGRKDRTTGFTIPAMCLFTLDGFNACSGHPEQIEAAVAREFVADLSASVSGNITGEISEQQLKGGEKR